MPSYDPRHEWEFFDDFLGGGTFGATPTAFDPWDITDTSAAGTPTYTRLDHGESTGAFALGVAELSHDTQAEAQNVCLSWGDKLALDLDKMRGFECRIRQGQATADATTQIAWGMSGDRNDTIDTMAVAAIFRIVGGDSTTNIVLETDDASENNDDIASGTTLVAAWKICRIDFTDKTDIKFYVNDARVGSATTFGMANHTGGVQPFFQLQKASDANADSVEIDYVRLWGVR
jgi:hypothetical protein